MCPATHNQAFLRRLVPIVVGSADRSPFRFDLPERGNNNAACRRSGAVLLRLSGVAAVPFGVGASSARLRFKAAIKSITGGGVETAPAA
jgi:hypothetical protein